MLSDSAVDLIDGMAEGPAFLVGGAVVVSEPRISNMLRGYARRFQEGTPDYAPHEHLIEVIKGFVAGLKSQGAETPGKELHEALRVDPELIYTVGATLLVLGIRYECKSLLSRGQSLPRSVMTEIEEAFDHWLTANKAHKYTGDAWVVHEDAVDTLLGTLDPSPATADLFWEKVFKPLGLPKDPRWLINAFDVLTPDQFAAAFSNPPSMT